MDENELHRLSARECRSRLDAGRISASALLDAIVARHETTHPAINAVIATDLDGARRAAAAADRRLKAGRPLSAVDGLPVTVKDNLGVCGMAATWGSAVFAERLCEEDDPAVDRLRRAGVVIWGKTNTPELALSATTENAVFGITRNPWDLALTPGGSSGGAAAALAAGVGALALATDAGGSARRPAAFTGTVGFRPSTGRIPRGSLFPDMAGDFQVLAPMARNVADVRLLYSALAGPHPHDRLTWLPAAPPAGGRRGALRVRFFPTVAGRPVAGPIAETLLTAAEALRSLGCEVAEMSAPFDLVQTERIWAVLAATSAAAFVGDHAGRTDIGVGIRTMAKNGAQFTAIEYRAVLEDIRRVRAHFDRLFADIDLLMCPASPCFPWTAGAPFPGGIDGQAASLRDTAIFLPFVNIAGLPAISIPAFHPSARLPAGIQLVARFGDDDRLLDVAEMLEGPIGCNDALPIEDL